MAGLAAFVGITALVICTPGQDTALTIRHALAGGRRGGIATSAGVAMGQAIWALATAAGLASLLVESRTAFETLRIAGALVLIALGAKALIAALGRSDEPTQASPRAQRQRHGFRQGLLSNLANPKMVVFFTTLLPQFAQDSRPAFPVLLGLGLLFSLMTFCWLSAYSIVVAHAQAVLVRGRVRQAVEAATGIVLVALGLRLATERP